MQSYHKLGLPSVLSVSFFGNFLNLFASCENTADIHNHTSVIPETIAKWKSKIIQLL